jgi:hypothetical protein
MSVVATAAAALIFRHQHEQATFDDARMWRSFHKAYAMSEGDPAGVVLLVCRGFCGGGSILRTLMVWSHCTVSKSVIRQNHLMLSVCVLFATAKQ